ncbi:hypothetical protein [Alicyclobacillus shizuokensis]|nr:hypothetical protein [Alicyclobacillus shizuokensis]
MMKQPELPDLIRDIEIIRSLNRLPFAKDAAEMETESGNSLDQEGPVPLS